jgi:hypothetical protein
VGRVLDAQYNDASGGIAHGCNLISHFLRAWTLDLVVTEEDLLALEKTVFSELNLA